MFNLPDHLVQIEAVKKAKELTGYSYAHQLKLSPSQNNIKEEWLEPTEIGDRLDLSSMKTNMLLMSLGLQYKNGKYWKPTELGKPISMKHAWNKNGKSGYNLKWNFNEINKLNQKYKTHLNQSVVITTNQTT